MYTRASIKRLKLNYNSNVSELPFVGPAQTEKLKKLRIESVKDLLLHFPVKYRDTSELISIGELIEEGEGTLEAKVIELKTNYLRSRKVIVRATLTDGVEVVKVSWFNQKYIARALKEGDTYIFELYQTQKVKESGKKSKEFYCKDFEKVHEGEQLRHLGRITPYYDQTAGVTSKWIRARLLSLKESIEEIAVETLPKEVIEEEGFIGIYEALIKIHFPEDFEDVHIARKRLGFDEMLQLALKLEEKKKERSQLISPKVDISEDEFKNFLTSLKFKLTDDQEKAIFQIFNDIKKEQPMNRLLNGDVGSGKTVVAAAAAYAAALNGLNTLLMAPTTVLAQQHFTSFSNLFKKLKILIELQISGSKKRAEIKSKKDNDKSKIDKVLRGESPESIQSSKDKKTIGKIIIGTHALLFNKEIKDIGLVIIDEQHRFGVSQRDALKNQTHQGSQEDQNNSLNIENKKARKSDQKIRQPITPHYLTMSATPIPRTLTNVLYGDMEISIIKEMPKNRIPIKSYLIKESDANKCYNWIKDQIIKSKSTKEQVNEQAFIIFPLIEESEKSDQKAALSMYQKLSTTIFKDLKTAVLHGRLKEPEKKEILNQFSNKDLDLLFSTSVIEVGIDMPDATMMIIENAERFGLAQLHQFRGRVGRGNLQSYCFLIPSKGVEESSAAHERLQYFVNHQSGFDVSEYDLLRRGPGEVYGVKQSGVPLLKIASITDIELLNRAREVIKRHPHLMN